MLLGEIIDIIESVAPLTQQEGWDNSGLQIGNRETEVARVLLCTDISDQIINEAIELSCQLIISHHPLIFHPIRSLQGRTIAERCAIKAIEHRIAIYSAHTSMDEYLHGVSGRMAEKLGITNYQVLCPKSNAEQNVGLGVIGEFDEPISLSELLALTKNTFHSPVIKYVEGSNSLIKRVALCGGAGADMVEAAIEKGADAYISADFKHHDFLDIDHRINVLDIGHFESEQFTKEIFAELLSDRVESIFANNDKSPIKIY